MTKGLAIGIDLGTTYSCAAVFRNNQVEIIQNDHNNRIMPSMVAFVDQQRLVGDEVKLMLSIDPQNTVYDSKRLIGRRYDDPTIKADMARWLFQVVNQDGKPAIKVKYKGEDKQFSPEEISAMILEKLKSRAEEYLEQPVTNAVITVPAYFNDAQRNATKDAGVIAGLNVLRIINEPTAAGYCYGLHKLHDKQQKVMIYDLGGGTFDVSILDIDGGVFKVIATAGNTHLGGSDFDNILIDHCVEHFRRQHNKDLTTNRRAMRRLMAACQRAKEYLSTLNQTPIELDVLYDQFDFSITITRARFEQLCSAKFEETMDTVRKTLKDANLDAKQIDSVVLVGGSTKIPQIQQLLKNFFGAQKVRSSLNQDLAVASGAAIQAAILNGDNSEAIRDLMLCDVVPLSLGIEVGYDFEMSTVIARNTSIPIKKSKVFVTSEDNQKVVTFQVFEGERPLTTDNNKLGQFKICGVPPAPKGNECFDVTFEVDVNGILNVTAKNQSTGIHNQITISNNGRLSKTVIDKMIRDAELYREEDRKQRERIAAKNTLERFVYKISNDIKTAHINQKSDRFRLDDMIEQILTMLDEDRATLTKQQMDNKRLELENLFNSVTDTGGN